MSQREEKFFSRSVTHIVTTRSIPSDTDVSAATSVSSRAASVPAQSSQRTINPSLLDKSADLQTVAQSRNGKQALDAISQRRKDALYVLGKPSLMPS